MPRFLPLFCFHTFGSARPESCPWESSLHNRFGVVLCTVARLSAQKNERCVQDERVFGSTRVYLAKRWLICSHTTMNYYCCREERSKQRGLHAFAIFSDRLGSGAWPRCNIAWLHLTAFLLFLSVVECSRWQCP